MGGSRTNGLHGRSRGSTVSKISNVSVLLISCRRSFFGPVQVQSRYKQDVQPGTKQGLRLLSGCRRLRELLSTTPTAEVTVEVRRMLGCIGYRG